jgi:3-oxoacyl-[acyl-carrier protein] reductase
VTTTSPRRVALVAGASGGLGLACARALAEQSLAVALCARRGEVVSNEAQKLGGASTAIGLAMDLRDEAGIMLAVAETERRLGPVDVLVLNGGGPPPSDAATVDVDAAKAAAELLLYGPIRLAAATLPAMRRRGWGRIVAIGSSAVQQPLPGLATSGMFRAALASWLKLLAAEVAADGVTVNMVLPGRIATDRVNELDSARADRSGDSVEAVRAASRATIPIGRYGDPAELGAAVAFLAGDRASYITGEQLRVDGGLVRAF